MGFDWFIQEVVSHVLFPIYVKLKDDHFFKGYMCQLTTFDLEEYKKCVK